MDIAYNLSPFMRRRACWKFIIKVSIPKESKNATDKSYLKFFVYALYSEDVTIINLVVVLIVQTRELTDGFGLYLFAYISSLFKDTYAVLTMSDVAIQPLVAGNVLCSEFNRSHYCLVLVAFLLVR